VNGPSHLPLVLFNDLIWWLPFSLFLLEGTRTGARIRASAPMLRASDLAASLALLLGLRPGTELFRKSAPRRLHRRPSLAVALGLGTIWIAGGIRPRRLLRVVGRPSSVVKTRIAGVAIAANRPPRRRLRRLAPESLAADPYDEIAPAVTF